MEFNTTEITWQTSYKLLTGAIVPRPIGWISTIDEDGVPNLAPFSFFNVVSGNPPHVLFCVSLRASEDLDKDTLRNVRVNGEFVVNIVTEDLAWAMNETAATLEPSINEFQHAGLTETPSTKIRPPRVAEAPIHFECRVTEIVNVGQKVGGSAVVIGEVVHIHVNDDFLLGDDKIDPDKLRPIGRMAGTDYVRTADRFSLIRPTDPAKS